MSSSNSSFSAFGSEQPYDATISSSSSSSYFSSSNPFFWFDSDDTEQRQEQEQVDIFSSLRRSDSEDATNISDSDSSNLPPSRHTYAPTFRAPSADKEDEEMKEVEAEESIESESEGAASSSTAAASVAASVPSAAWPLSLHPSLTKKFKSPARVVASSGGIAATNSVGGAVTLATPSRAAASPPLLLKSKLLSSSSPSSFSTTSQLPFKMIRFVKSTEVLNAEDALDTPPTAGAAASNVSKSVKKSLLTIGQHSIGVTGTPNSLLWTPSLLTPLKRSPLAASKTSKPFVSPRQLASNATVASSSPHSLRELACIWFVTYCLAGRKKQQHREGYLHLFRSTITQLQQKQQISDESSTSTESKSCDVVPPAAISYLKSQLYTDRGVIVDEQIGRAVMEYEEVPIQRRKRVRTGEEVDAGIEYTKKRRGNDEEGDKETIDLVDNSAPAPTMIQNTFSEGEFVQLGQYECELEYQLDKAEYDFAVKLANGTIGDAPLSRRSRTTSVTITGTPLNSSNIGYRLLHSLGLSENGGVLGKKSDTSRVLKEPIPFTYVKQDLRPGIGFRDTNVLARIDQEKQLERKQSYRGGRGGGRGGRGRR